MNHGTKNILSQSNPFDYFDAIYCINLDSRPDRWLAVQKQFEIMNIHHRVIRFSAIETAENGHIGCMMSHCAIIKNAKQAGLKNVLVFEDDIIFSSTIDDVATYISSAQTYQWDILYLSGQFPFGEVPILSHLSHNIYRGIGIKGTHAVAYSSSIFDAVIGISETTKSIQEFIKKYTAIDQYFSRVLQPKILAIIYQKPLVINAPGKSDIGKSYSDLNHLIVDNFYFWKTLYFFRGFSLFFRTFRTIIIFCINLTIRLYKPVSK